MSSTHCSSRSVSGSRDEGGGCRDGCRGGRESERLGGEDRRGGRSAERSLVTLRRRTPKVEALEVVDPRGRLGDKGTEGKCMTDSVCELEVVIFCLSVTSTQLVVGTVTTLGKDGIKCEVG